MFSGVFSRSLRKTQCRDAYSRSASSYLFTALHNLRVDRSTSFRDLNTDKQFTALSPLMRAAREAEVPAARKLP